LLDGLTAQLASIRDTAVGKDHEASSEREAKRTSGESKFGDHNIERAASNVFSASNS
jgi:hypothetical protein